jgi:DNA mismatch repair protein MLH3
MQQTPDGSGLKWNTAPIVSQTVLGSKSPLFDKAGSILRKPFDDVDEASATPKHDVTGRSPPDVKAATETGSERETVVWVDPITKIKSIIDPRTGFAVKSRANETKAPPRLVGREGAEDVRRPPHWKPATGREKNTVFLATESRIPQVLQVSETLGCEHVGHSHECAEEVPDGNVLVTLEGRISKTALQKAQTLAQVDQKFILVKAATEPPANASRGFGSDGLLILIDQHAADERCKVEGLLKDYFTPDAAGTGQLVVQTQMLDKLLHFDLASQDKELLVRFKSHFAHWGILYDIPNTQETPQNGAAVEVHSLPPSILERCRLEPRLLVDLLRKEIWKLHATGSAGARGLVPRDASGDWVSWFHDCPEGILDLINSRACRSRLLTLGRDTRLG